MLKRYQGSILSATKTATSQTTASGVWPLDQQMRLQNAFLWPVTGASSFTISPSVSGKSTWNLKTDGALTLTSANTYTIVPDNDFYADANVWGAGGGGGYYNDSFQNRGNGGGGGYSTGRVLFKAGTTYYLVVGGGGGKGKNSGTNAYSLGGAPGGGGNSGQRDNSHGAGGGGGFSGIFKGSQTQANAVIIAGGGGGGIGYPGYDAGAGGGSSGQAGENSGGGGGTQSAGGAGNQSGSALQGGVGANSGDPGGGGGGGYYGGGGGNGSRPGGGGSGYIGHADLSNASTTVGDYRNPGNTSATGYVSNVGYGGYGSSSAGATDMQDGYAGEIYLVAVA